MVGIRAAPHVEVDDCVHCTNIRESGLRKLARCGARIVIATILTTRVTINTCACRVAQASGYGSRATILPHGRSGLHYTLQHIVCGQAATYRTASNACPIDTHIIMHESHAVFVNNNARCAQAHTARLSWLPMQTLRCRPARTLIGSHQLMQRSMATCAARACSMICEHEPITILIALNICRVAQNTRRGDHGHSARPMSPFQALSLVIITEMVQISLSWRAARATYVQLLQLRKTHAGLCD